MIHHHLYLMINWVQNQSSNFVQYSRFYCLSKTKQYHDSRFPSVQSSFWKNHPSFWWCCMAISDGLWIIQVEGHPIEKQILCVKRHSILSTVCMLYCYSLSVQGSRGRCPAQGTKPLWKFYRRPWTRVEQDPFSLSEKVPSLMMSNQTFHQILSMYKKCARS